jgi:hypothetical protein
MNAAMTSAELPPEPPRAIPTWFFVRRMQAMSFCGVLFAVTDVIVLVVLGVVMRHVGGTWLPLADMRLDRVHSIATAAVIDKEFISYIHLDSKSPWRVTFRFAPPDGSPVQASGFTYDQSYKDKQAGDTIQVEYNPAIPSMARPAGGYVGSGPAWIFLVVMGVVAPLELVGVGMLVAVWWGARRERYLLTYGVGGEAEVVSVRASPNVRFGSRSPFDVCYRFTDHTGQEIVSQDRTYQYRWAEALRPGDCVGVVYNPFSPATNVLWLHGTDLPPESARFEAAETDRVQ